MSRLWPDGLPLQVQCDTLGRPVAVLIGGRRRRVREIMTRRRRRGAWWQHEFWQEYLTLVTDDRLIMTLLRDLPDGGWRLLRLYD
jgi:hypothetical protein